MAITAYFIDVATDVGFTQLVVNNFNVGLVTSYDVSSLTPHTTYYYRVRSYDGVNTSANSNIISLTTDYLHVGGSPSGGGGLGTHSGAASAKHAEQAAGLALLASIIDLMGNEKGDDQ